jgi:hypothetical protein
MSFEVVAAITAFVGLFIIWVVLPSLVKKHHESKLKVE